MWEDFYMKILSYCRMLKLTDIIDILIISYVIYKALVLIRDTRAMQLLKGIGVIIIAVQVSRWLGLHAVDYLLGNTMQVGILAVFVVFQPELRRALEQMGRSSIGKWMNFDEQNRGSAYKTQVIGEVVRAVENLSKNKIGALMVIERKIRIGDIIGTGITLNADITAEILVNVFIPKTPLHDGAVVMRENKIEAAACFLPLSQNPGLSKELGTRHRAGLGISEESDAVVIIVSEETGMVSVALDGDLNFNLSSEELIRLLTRTLSSQRAKKFSKNIFSRGEGKRV